MCAPRRFGAAIVALAALALLLGDGGRAGAAPIIWSPALPILVDADVDTNGTLVDAFNIGSSFGPSLGSPTINGVTFTGQAVANGSNTFGNYNLTFSGGSFFAANNLFSPNSPFANLSTNYKTLLASLALVEGPTGQFTLTISGLTVGHQYQFQWWLDDSAESASPEFFTSATAGNMVTLSSNTGSPNGGVGQFAVGTFTADATIEQILFQQENGGPENAAGINAFQLRDLSPPSSSVPEPSSLALFGLGAAGLAVWRRRRRA